MGMRKKWSIKDDGILRDGWSLGKKAFELAQELNRTETAVRGRIQKLGVRRSRDYLHKIHSEQSSGRRNPNARWSVEDENLLRHLYVTQGLCVSEMASAFPSKTQTAVQVKIKRMGLRHTGAQKKTILSRLNKGDRNGMYGRPGPRRGVVLSDETKAKLSKRAKEDFAYGKRVVLRGSLNPMYGKISPMRGKNLPESAKITLSRKTAQRWSGRSEEFKRAHLKKMRAGWAKWVKSRRPTKIEQAVSEWLGQLGVEFSSEEVVGFYVVDFKVGEVIIEAHGDYWHANPLMYDQNSLDGTQKANVRRDKAKRTYLTRRGFTLVELWESDILGDPVSCISVLEEAVG